MRSSQSLTDLIEEVWQARLLDDPILATGVGDDRYLDRLPEATEAAEDRRAAQAAGFLSRLEGFDPAALAPAEALNRDLLARELREALEAHAFGAFRMPLYKPSGPHAFLPDLVLLTPFRHARDYRAYLGRLNAFGPYIRDLVGLMRSGMAKGLVPARAALAGVEDSIRALAGGPVEASPFFAPFAAFPAAVPAAERPALVEEGRAAVEGSVFPAFQALLDFVERDYLPAARPEPGLSALPRGCEYYAFLVRKYTTLDVTPQQVHEVGLSEVARIRQEMQAVAAATGFQGELRAFIQSLRSDPRFYVTRPEDLLKEVAWLMKRMDGELPRLFSVLPRTPYGMREVPAHIAPASTTAYYFPPSGSGATAGYYYVNTYDLASRPLYEYEALSFHEAVPGHHLQLALQQEMQGVPAFRRFSQIDAFIEGWALYAERLGLEVGFYTDPYQNFGRLIYEMWRACRLVVDTGLHALGWSRQRAVDFMAENTALSLLNIHNEVDRYIAWPGQALSYKMGELKIRELRAAAEAQLGAGFDLRDFHRALLEEGAIPLALLERKMRAYIEQRSEAKPAMEERP